MITATKQKAVTSPGQLVLGYARVGDGNPLRLVEDTNALTDFTRRHGLMLGTVFIDRHGRMPAMERPAFRAMLDVVRYLPPGGLVVPNVWHLAQGEQELTRLLHTFAALRCRIFMTREAKPASLIRLRQPSSTR
jgi:hypothetical protein